MIRKSIANFGTTRRLREIMTDAPWSNHDLLVSTILLFIGVALFIEPSITSKLRAMTYLHETWGPRNLAILFVVVGSVNLVVTLWCVSPHFYVRLISRMAGAFCLMLLAFSTCLFSPIAPPTITYLLVGLWSVWGILRTHKSGR